MAVREKDGPRLHYLEFATGVIRRVCRSTLAAEANGLVAAVEACDYLRSVMLAITRPTLAIKDLLDRGDVIDATVYTDAKSLYDVAVRDCSRPQDKRLRSSLRSFARC